MSSVDHDGCSIHYTTAGPSDAPAVVFLGDLGFGAWQWSWQYDAVAGPFRAVVVDTRGCGRSDAPAGSWEIGEFVADLDAVLADQNLRKAHLVGCGLGGCVALAAAHRTNRARSLTLIGTQATAGEFDPTDLRADPTDDTLRASTTALLSNEFVASDDAPIQQIVEWRHEEDAPQRVQSTQAAAIADFDPEPLYEVTLPSLVIAGGRDSVVPSESAEKLADDLPRGEYREFPEAAHLVTVERSAAVNDELVGFLESVTDS
jgi:Predicted hydrolases or acyltransferases (alpha/beta hydrolase superfamily)